MTKPKPTVKAAVVVTKPPKPAVKVCKDCLKLDEPPKRPRRAPYPGPRCYEHDRAAKSARRNRDKQYKVTARYGLEPELYEAIYEAQQGRCAWCGKADGSAKRLAVDHDHSCCAGSTSCGRCVRGLLCSPCNQFLGFQMGDNPETVRRGARYLERPPAQEVIVAWNGPASSAVG